MTAWVAVLAGMLAAALRGPAPGSHGRSPGSAAAPSAIVESGWMRRGSWLWSSLAGVAAALFVSGPWGVAAGVVAAAATLAWIGRSERAVRAPTT